MGRRENHADWTLEGSEEAMHLLKGEEVDQACVGGSSGCQDKQRRVTETCGPKMCELDCGSIGFAYLRDGKE